MAVDTKKIRSNLGDRDGIGLNREDVNELLDIYDHYMANIHVDVRHDVLLKMRKEALNRLVNGKSVPRRV